MSKILVNGKTVEFSHTAVNKDMHLFIDGYHNPKVCPECIEPGVLAGVGAAPAHSEIQKQVTLGKLDELLWARDMSEQDITGHPLISLNYVNERIATLQAELEDKT